MEFFDYFYPTIKELFDKNYDKLIEFCENKKKEYNNVTKQTFSGFYNMRLHINFDNMIHKLNDAKLYKAIL
jgi:hypothetical protein